jgi:hypothetical protein
MQKKIKEQIAFIDSGHFERWKSFGSEWTKKNVQELTVPSTGCSTYVLSGRSLSRCMLPLKQQSQKLQCFADETDRICLLRLEDANMALSLADFTKLLGSPDLKRSLQYPDKYSPAAQWIYASRGITIYVRDENPKISFPLACVSLYEPATVTEYLEKLGGRDTMIYFNEK